MPHIRVKFLNGHEDENDHEEVKGWHLLAKGVGDGEYTACGLAVTEYDITQEEKQKAGITCKTCLDVVRYYKSIKL